MSTEGRATVTEEQRKLVREQISRERTKAIDHYRRNYGQSPFQPVSTETGEALTALLTTLEAREPHPEDRCDNCSGPNPVWSAPNDLWNEVVGSPNGILCPACFAQMALDRPQGEGQQLTQERWRDLAEGVQSTWETGQRYAREVPSPDTTPEEQENRALAGRTSQEELAEVARLLGVMWPPMDDGPDEPSSCDSCGEPSPELTPVEARDEESGEVTPVRLCPPCLEEARVTPEANPDV